MMSEEPVRANFKTPSQHFHWETEHWRKPYQSTVRLARLLIRFIQN